MWCDFRKTKQNTLNTIWQALNDNPDWNDYEIAEKVLFIEDREEYAAVEI